MIVKREQGEAGSLTAINPTQSVPPGFTRAPLLTPAIGLIAGITTDYHLNPPVTACVILLTAAFSTLAFRQLRSRACPIAVFILAACTGGLLHHAAYHRIPPNHIVRYTIAEEPILARVRGRIVTEPKLSAPNAGPFQRWLYAPDRTTLLMQAEAVKTSGDWTAATGLVRVSIKQSVVDLQVGRRVEAFGKLYRPPPARNPGQFDGALWQRRHGVLAGMTCEQRESLNLLNETNGSKPDLLHSLRRRLRSLLLDEMLAEGDPSAGLFDAMVLARRSGVDPALEEAFLAIGCGHYLAASGFHVGVLAMFVYGIGRLLGTTRRTAAGFVIAAAIAYALIAEPRPAIFRATVATTAVCLGLVLRKRGSTLNWLALSAILFLIWRPMELFDVGFQLSYACVTGIILLTPILLERVPRLRVQPADELVAALRDEPTEAAHARHSIGRKLATAVALSAAVALAAWLSALPLALWHFHRWSPLGWLYSMIIFLPVAALMISGFAVMLIGLVSPWLATLLNPAIKLPAAILVSAVDAVGSLPGTSAYITHPPLIWVLAYYATAIAVVAARAGRLRPRWIAAGGACLALSTVYWSLPPAASDRLTATFLSVGAGSATVLELPDGTTAVYDCGSQGAYDPGALVLLPYLEHRGISRIDHVFISHPNLDHYSGLLTVADRIPIGEVIVSPMFERLARQDDSATQLLTELARRGVPVLTIDAGAEPLHLGGATVDVLWPAPDSPQNLSANDSSLVLRIRHAGRSILLTGDIEEPAQAALLASGADLSADVLILPHHGAVERNTADFITAVQPSHLVQSSWRETAAKRAALREATGAVPLLNTGRHGAVQATLEPGRFHVRSTARTESDTTRNPNSVGRAK